MLEWRGMRMWFLRALFAVAVLVQWPVAGVRAETTGAPLAAITAVDANNFPRMFAYLTVTGADGSPVADLSESAFTLSENGKDVPPTAVRAVTLGVQTVFALDVGPTFKTRDLRGNSRLDYLRLGINAFAQAEDGLQPSLDDVSLITPEQELLIHASTRGPMVDALDRYATEFAGATDHVALLTRAIDIASDATTRPGMRRIVVFASNGLADNNVPVDVETLVQRAQSAGIKVITIYVGPDGTQEGPGARALQSLAEQTGGVHIYLAGDDSLAPVFDTLAAERGQYQIEYRSMLNETGQHRLGVSVELANGQIVRTRDAVFQLRVEPPAVALGTLPESAEPATSDATLVIPYSLNFSDGHVRTLRSVELLVDGDVAARANEGGEAIDWPLTGITESLTRTVQIRVVDELGLEGLSPTATVFVAAPPAKIVQPAAATMTARATPYALWAGLLSLVALVAFGAYVWHRQGWQLPQALKNLRLPGRPTVGKAAPLPQEPGEAPGAGSAPQPAVARPVSAEPITTVETTQPMRPARANGSGRLRMPDLGNLARPQMPRVTVPSLALPRRLTQPLSAAFAAAQQRGDLANSHAVLELVDRSAPQRTRIELNGVSLRFGRDPDLAEVTFDDRSVSRLHARIEAVAENVYRIFDEGSTSGTWVNFSQVTSPEGQELSTGDVINLGRVKLKFKKPRKVNGAA